MVFSILFSIAIVGLAIGNGASEYGLEGENPGIADKTRFIASIYIPVPTQENLEEKDINGITYFYQKANEKQISEYDALLNQNRRAYEDLFGTGNGEPLAVEIHKDLESLQAASFLDDVGGYYNAINQTIHLQAEEEYWETMLLHEYTHYHIDQYLTQRNIPLDEIPQWFQEGSAEYMGNKGELPYDYEKVETVDFRLLDTNDGFHDTANESFDPYVQSYLAVVSLVQLHGEGIITELLLAKTTEEFYEKIEAAAQQDLATFQETFIDSLILERQKIREKVEWAKKAIEIEQFEEAEVILTELLQEKDAGVVEEAAWLLSDLYVAQGLYGELAALLEKKVEQGDSWSKVGDLIQLGEVYLLIDPSQALEFVKQAHEEKAAGDIVAYDTRKLIAIYEKIASEQALEGYKQLFEEELIFHEFIRNELHEKLKNEYPEAFHGKLGEWP
ncbi:hypothetical protein [Planococcus sp. YIM B11945]|uniref:hypothetical protein n=1 Tax=Planococcus sp. YIM B11945 TaxID=3435410 RepID=UPI003D7D14BD